MVRRVASIFGDKRGYMKNAQLWSDPQLGYFVVDIRAAL